MSDGKSKYAVGKDKIKMIDWGGGGEGEKMQMVEED
jgi:hypothetical protein